MNIKKILFPSRCAICDSPLSWNIEHCCDLCKKNINYISDPYCCKCGKSLRQEEKEYCFDCSTKHHYFTKGRALYEYHLVKDSIFRFKYQGRMEYAAFYAKEIVEQFALEIKKWNVDGIVPVPLHASKRTKRGYNQAELIAEEMGKILSIKVYNNFVQRCKKTKPQKDLDNLQRQKNLKKAFKIVGNDVKLNTIILIDDIYTTGATVDEIAKELKRINISNVYVISITIGKGL